MYLRSYSFNENTPQGYLRTYVRIPWRSHLGFWDRCVALTKSRGDLGALGGGVGMLSNEAELLHILLLAIIISLIRTCH